MCAWKKPCILMRKLTSESIIIMEDMKENDDVRV